MENVIKEICCTVNLVCWNVIELKLSSVVQRARGDYVTSRFEKECLNPRQQAWPKRSCRSLPRLLATIAEGGERGAGPKTGNPSSRATLRLLRTGSGQAQDGLRAAKPSARIAQPQLRQGPPGWVSFKGGDMGQPLSAA